MWKYVIGFLIACMVIVQPVNSGHAALKFMNSAEYEMLFTEGDSPELSKVLTYEQVVDLAVENSNKLKNQKERTEQLEVLKKEILAAMDFTTSERRVNWLVDMQEKRQLLTLVQTEIDLGMSSRMEDLGKEGLAFQVRAIFDEIIRLEEKLKLNNLLLSNLKQKLKHTEIKTELGLESVFNLEKIRREYQEQKHYQEMLLKSLNNIYVKLGILLGISDIEEYTILVDDYFLQVMDPVNLDFHIIRSINSDPYIWLKKRELEKTEKGLWLYTYTGVEEPYRVREGNVYIAKNELAEMKKNLEEILRSRYYHILQLEENYMAINSRFAQAEDTLRALRLQYQLGLATEMNVKEAECAVASIEYEMGEIAFRHRMAVLLFNKPYLEPTYM